MMTFVFTELPVTTAFDTDSTPSIRFNLRRFVLSSLDASLDNPILVPFKCLPKLKIKKNPKQKLRAVVINRSQGDVCGWAGNELKEQAT